MQASGLASLLGAYNSDSDSEDDDGAPTTSWGICSGAKNGEYMLVTLSWFQGNAFSGLNPAVILLNPSINCSPLNYPQPLHTL